MTNTGTLVSLWARTHSRYLWPGCPKRPASPSNIRAYEPFHSGHLHNKAFGSVTMATSEHRSVESLNIKTTRPRCKLVGQQHCSTTSRMAAPTSTRHLPSRRQKSWKRLREAPPVYVKIRLEITHHHFPLCQ